MIEFLFVEKTNALTRGQHVGTIRN